MPPMCLPRHFRSFFGGEALLCHYQRTTRRRSSTFSAAFSIMGRGSLMRRRADPHFCSLSHVPAALKVLPFYSGSSFQVSGSWMSLVHTSRTPRP